MLQNWNNLSIQSFGVLQDGNTWTGLNNFTGGIEINGVPATFPIYQAGYNPALGLGSAANYAVSALAPSILQYGADSTGTVDSTPAFVAAMVANPSGGRIRIPCGKYLITGVTNNVPGLTFEGDNQQCVRLANTSTSSVAWTITAAYANLYNVTMWPTVRNGQPQIKITGLAAYWVGLRDVETIYGGGIAYVNGPNAGWFQRVQVRSLISSIGLDVEGTASQQALALTIDDTYFDNPWPVAEPNGLFTTWAASTSMAAGAVVDKNGSFWQAAAACTTGATGPSGLPSGTTPESQFTNTVSDGSCNWYWVSLNGLYMIYNNSYGRSLFIHDSGFLDGAIGIVFADTINDGGSWPEFTRFNNVTTDSNLYGGMVAGAGADFRLVNDFHSSIGYGTGVVFGAGFRGDLTISGSIIANNYADGLDINGGVQNFHITDNSISSNGRGTGVWNNINVLGKGVVGFSGFSAGSGYSSTPAVSVSGGGGSGAAVAIAYMSGGSIGALVINSRGSGYTSAPAISFSGGGGSGAAVTAVLGGPSGGSITNNSTGVSQIFASQIPTASYGLLLSAVPSDYLTVTGNYCGIGATLACFLNQSTGTHNYVPAGANN